MKKCIGLICFEFELPDDINSVKLTVSDAQGRTVDKLTLIGKQVQKRLTLRQVRE